MIGSRLMGVPVQRRTNVCVILQLPEWLSILELRTQDIHNLIYKYIFIKKTQILPCDTPVTDSISLDILST